MKGKDSSRHRSPASSHHFETRFALADPTTHNVIPYQRELLLGDFHLVKGDCDLEFLGKSVRLELL